MMMHALSRVFDSGTSVVCNDGGERRMGGCHGKGERGKMGWDEGVRGERDEGGAGDKGRMQDR